MGEDFDPIEEGKRIAREYLSKRGWAKEWRRSLERQLYPAVEREEFEAKEKQCDEREEEAEGAFSAKVESWRKDPSPQAKEVLRAIVQMLGRRKDLGFFGKRIVDRLTKELGPL